jgi:large subunit ribosomal protein L6
VTVSPGRVSVKGPNATLERTLPSEITVDKEGDEIRVSRPSDSGHHRSLHGLTRTLIANMVLGVTEGFEKQLEIHGVGYRAASKGKDVELSLGFSHPVLFPAPDGVTLEVPAPNRIIIKGANKELVGQVAADLRALRKPDPYKQKGVRYAGEHIRKKAGQTAK